MDNIPLIVVLFMAGFALGWTIGALQERDRRGIFGLSGDDIQLLVAALDAYGDMISDLMKRAKDPDQAQMLSARFDKVWTLADKIFK